MHDHLRAAEDHLGINLQNLQRAAGETTNRVADARDSVLEHLSQTTDADGTGLDIVVFGSIARQEMTPGSDFDWLVIAHKLGPDPELYRQFREAAEAGRRALGVDKPGRSGLFGVVVAAPDLVDLIGLEQDTNLSHSRRVLVLQESLSLTESKNADGGVRHQHLLQSIVRRYLADYESDPGPLVPRFLLNDILRYWRTVAVDYQAKRWEELVAEKWGLRYFKLRSTRKLTFAGSLASLFMPVIAQRSTTVEYLQQQFELPGLARLAQLHEHLGDQGNQALAEVLTLADTFSGWLADAEFRDEMNKVTNPRDPNPPDIFINAKRVTDQLQRSLESLFFAETPIPGTSESVAGLSKKYLSF